MAELGVTLIAAEECAAAPADVPWFGDHAFGVRCGVFAGFRRGRCERRGRGLDGLLRRLRGRVDRMFAALAHQFIDALDIAAHAEAAIAAEAAVAIEYRQAGQFDR